MGKGKRHYICNEVEQAVKCFEEATQKLYVCPLFYSTNFRSLLFASVFKIESAVARGLWD